MKITISLQKNTQHIIDISEDATVADLVKETKIKIGVKDFDLQIKHNRMQIDLSDNTKSIQSLEIKDQSVIQVSLFPARPSDKKLEKMQSIEVFNERFEQVKIEYN